MRGSDRSGKSREQQGFPVKAKRVGKNGFLALNDCCVKKQDIMFFLQTAVPVFLLQGGGLRESTDRQPHGPEQPLYFSRSREQLLILSQ